MKLAVRDKIIQRNSCDSITNIKLEEIEREYLNFEEIKQLSETIPLTENAKEVARMFLFGCFTGLSFANLVTLTFKQIEGDTVKFFREKTKTWHHVPLNETALSLLGDTAICDPQDRIFSVPKHRQCSYILEKWGKEAGIKKHLHMHLSRHTFATLSLTFVAVGERGRHSYSSNNGTSWDNGTWSDTDHVTGVEFGNNIFIAPSSTNLTKSTDNGSNWNLIGAGLKVYDVAFGNSTFVACGAEGAIVTTSDNGSSWTTRTSGASTNTLYGITFGSNQFFSVGSSGKLIKSINNGSSWSTVDSTVSNSLYSIVFGNSTFVAVGYRTVIVSTDNGSTFTEKENRYTFYDVTFGNGVFVAVGNDENIYTSTDGDTWTKVYGKP